MKKISLLVSMIIMSALSFVSCSNPAGGESSGTEGSDVSINITKEITNLKPINFNGRYSFSYLTDNKNEQGDAVVEKNKAKIWNSDTLNNDNYSIYVYKVSFDDLPDSLKEDWGQNNGNNNFVFSKTEIDKFILTFNPNNNSTSNIKVQGADYFGTLDGDTSIVAWNETSQIFFNIANPKEGPTGAVTVREKSLTPYNLIGEWEGGISKKGEGKVTIKYIDEAGGKEFDGDYFTYKIDKDALPRDFISWYDISKESNFIVFSKNEISSFTLNYAPKSNENTGFSLTDADLLGYEFKKSNGKYKFAVHNSKNILEFAK